MKLAVNFSSLSDLATWQLTRPPLTIISKFPYPAPLPSTTKKRVRKKECSQLFLSLLILRAKSFYTYRAATTTEILVFSVRISKKKRFRSNIHNPRYIFKGLSIFWTNSPTMCQHNYSTERQQNWTFSRPTPFADVICGWFLNHQLHSLLYQKTETELMKLKFK